MSIASLLYRNSPVLVQHAAVSAYGVYWRRLRFGPGFRAACDAYAERERYTHDEWMEWQRHALQHLLQSAVVNVGHYAGTYTPRQKEAARAGVLDELPLLEKRPLRDDPWAFVDRTRKAGRQYVFHTSGSTGTPIATIWRKSEI